MYESFNISFTYVVFPDKNTVSLSKSDSIFKRLA